MTKEEALVVLKEMYKDSVRSVVYYKEPDQENINIANALNVAIHDLEKQSEIIRCCNCKRYGEENCFMRIERLWELRPDDFCSQAERRENATF